jgi:hypothetical protein
MTSSALTQLVGQAGCFAKPAPSNVATDARCPTSSAAVPLWSAGTGIYRVDRLFRTGAEPRKAKADLSHPKVGVQDGSTSHFGRRHCELGQPVTLGSGGFAATLSVGVCAS